MNLPSKIKPAVEDLGKIGDAHLSDVPKLEDCRPGLRPIEYNVIVAPAAMKEKLGSVFIPDEAREMRELGMQVGRIVSVSPIAFNYDHWPQGEEPPKAGALVWFARYAGGEFEGLDGKRYRIVKDKDIGAVIDE